ncbi:MAG TPA: diacylglycerol kinase family protein [bacterium]|nr:diacylglycerol kinase family protein [bacterium]
MALTLIVANLRSGGGRARDALPLVTSALRRAGREYDLIVTPTGDATASLLASALHSRADEVGQVVALGGDGTINGAVNGLIASGADVPLGIVACGTGNETVRSLGLSKNPRKAIQTLLRGRVCPIDVGVVNGRYFLNTFGLGADVEVVKMTNALRARYRFARNRSVYYVAALMLLSSGFEPFNVEIESDGRSFSGRALMIAVANGRIYGERLLALPSPSLTDGLLDVYLLQELATRRFRKTARLLRRLPVPELSVQRCSQVSIRLDQRREAQVDGSLAGAASAFTLSLLPARIAVIHPTPPALVATPVLTTVPAGSLAGRA